MAGAQSQVWMVVALVGGVAALVAVLVEGTLIQMALLDSCKRLGTEAVVFACESSLLETHGNL